MGSSFNPTDDACIGMGSHGRVVEGSENQSFGFENPQIHVISQILETIRAFASKILQYIVLHTRIYVL